MAGVTFRAEIAELKRGKAKVDPETARVTQNGRVILEGVTKEALVALLEMDGDVEVTIDVVQQALGLRKAASGGKKG